MDETIITILKPILYAILSALATILGIYIKKLGTKAAEYIKSKVDESTYSQAIEVAKGLYISLEDKYAGTLVKKGLEKKQEMESLLTERFPSLTKTELDSINKIVWLSFQEGYDGTYKRDLLTNNNSDDSSERLDG